MLITIHLDSVEKSSEKKKRSLMRSYDRKNNVDGSSRHQKQINSFDTEFLPERSFVSIADKVHIISDPYHIRSYHIHIISNHVHIISISYQLMSVSYPYHINSFPNHINSSPYHIHIISTHFRIISTAFPYVASTICTYIKGSAGSKET